MIMLPDCIINRMTEDELRNYITHVRKVYDGQREVITADGLLVEALESVYRHRSHLEDCLITLDISEHHLDDIQNELRKKYAKPEDYGTIGVVCDTKGD